MPAPPVQPSLKRMALASLASICLAPVLSLPAATPPLIPTFESGKSPTTEIHVDPAGNDTTGNGSAANPYATIARGIQNATPGAAVRIHPGTYNVRVNITDLAGTAANPIWIGGAPNETNPVVQGQSEGVHLTRTNYLILHDLEVRNTSQNGINCDDGGQYSNPDATRHMIFRDLYIHNIGGTGNQDGLKLSGVDDYFVLNCRIDTIGGGISGAGVDHVGCHNGILAYNEISNTAGSGIQCKGGSENLEIRANRITDFGQRSVNIGGSTDFAFFRPLLSTTEPNFEAKNIRLIANIFKGGVASLAFVGCVDCEAVNNTFINPNNWLVRILQETTSDATYTFLACANNTIKNNIFYFDRSTLANSNINIGANTNAPSFTWTNNLWFAHNNPAQSTPNPNPTQSNAIFGDDPDFAGPATGDYRLQARSPAVGAGLALAGPETDYTGIPFKIPPSIGAFEISPWQAWRAFHFPSPAQLADPAISGPANSECHVNVTIEVSQNLADWFSGPIHTLTNPPNNLGDGTNLITVDDLTLLGTTSLRFMRAAIQFLDGG
jgi:hypothetical protein